MHRHIEWLPHVGGGGARAQHAHHCRLCSKSYVFVGGFCISSFYCLIVITHHCRLCSEPYVFDDFLFLLRLLHAHHYWLFPTLLICVCCFSVSSFFCLIVISATCIHYTLLFFVIVYKYDMFWFLYFICIRLPVVNVICVPFFCCVFS